MLEAFIPSYLLQCNGFPGGRLVKNLLAMQETCVQSLGQEDPTEKGVANPPQYSYLGNPTDRGAWWAIVHGIAKESEMT